MSPDAQRRLATSAGLAVSLRLVATGVISFLAITADSNSTGRWLNDEASYGRATDALMRSPWDQALPQGLDHLGGNGYLGLTTAISLAIGGVDALSFQLARTPESSSVTEGGASPVSAPPAAAVRARAPPPPADQLR